jgi:2-dehydropantoate 2-reductase
MRHAILGPGGVGGLVGACLAKTGAPVTMVVRQESLAQYPHQLQLESPFGNFTVPIERAAQVPPVDILWIAVKTTQLEAALRAISSAAPPGMIVPLENGIDHVNLLRSRFGDHRIFPATIAGETERIAPGHIVHRSPFARLNVIARARSRLEATLNQLGQIGFNCQFIEDEATLLWSKLVFLAPLALTTTAAGVPKGEIVATPHGLEQLESSLREACAVAAAEGAQVDPDTELARILKLPDATRSSMQKDVESGKTPELDAIGGPVLRGGARHGIPVPATRSLVSAIEQKAGLRLVLN